MSHLIGVFGSDDEEEKPQKNSTKKPSKKDTQNQAGAPKDHEPRDIKAHPPRFEEERSPSLKKEHSKKEQNGEYPDKKEKPRNKRRTDRAERKKNRKKYLHSGSKEETKENGEGDESPEPKNSPLIKPEKPTLIKTLNFDQKECEITLETFLHDEYENYECKPSNTIERLIEEDDYGNVEYKLKLVNPPPERIQHLTTQMKFRLQEGHGEAKYEIGVEDDGTPTGLSREEMFCSLRTLCTMASNLKADLIILRMRDGYQGKTAELLVRSNQKEGIKLDIKIMLLGDKQSGKSTLIGVLTSGQNDNGKGSARMFVHVHKHEVLSGETSSLSHHILGFDSQGNVTNHSDYGHPSWEQIVDSSTKILTFLDIGGNEKYTTKIISGLCSLYPDYALIVVSATKGVTPIAEQHIKLAVVFEVPIIIVITHIDLVNETDAYSLRDDIEKVIRKFAEDKYLSVCVASNEEDNVILSRTLKESLVVPIFMVSNVEGNGLNLFKSFLNLLPVNNPLSANAHLHTEFYIHTTFNKPNHVILGGTVIKGYIKKHQILYLGPDEKGKFRHVEVANIRCNKVPVKCAYCGQSCTIEVKLGKFAQQWLDSSKDSIRRVDAKSSPKAAFDFTAEISLFEEKTTNAVIWENYEPVVTSQTTHQVCMINFDEADAEEIKEEDLKQLKELTDNLGTEKGRRKREKNRSREPSLPKLVLGKQKSKSQDFKEITPKAEDVDSDSTISPNKKGTSFSRRKIATMFISSNELKTQGNGTTEETKTEERKPRDMGNNPLAKAFNLEQNRKISFQEKIKNIKKSIYMYADDFAPRKKNKLRFISIKPTETKLLRFKFRYHPEYITKGQRIIINDSTMKAIGTVKEVFYCNPET